MKITNVNNFCLNVNTGSLKVTILSLGPSSHTMHPQLQRNKSRKLLFGPHFVETPLRHVASYFTRKARDFISLAADATPQLCNEQPTVYKCTSEACASDKTPPSHLLFKLAEDTSRMLCDATTESCVKRDFQEESIRTLGKIVVLYMYIIYRSHRAIVRYRVSDVTIIVTA